LPRLPRGFLKRLLSSMQRPVDEPLRVVDTDGVDVGRRAEGLRTLRRRAADEDHLEVLQVLPQARLGRPHQLADALRGEDEHVLGEAVSLQLSEGGEGTGGLASSHS
jgi:hypothetical protein